MSPEYPNVNLPNSLAAGLWRDLNPAAGGCGGAACITSDSTTSKFAVSYNNVRNYANASRQTFQIVLNSDGSIVYQYAGVTNDVSTSVGMENQTGTAGTAYGSPSNGLAIKFTPVAVGGETLQNLEYEYDGVGNITLITDNLNSTRSQTFTHDELNRLMTAQSSSYGANDPISYDYSEIGNMMHNSLLGTNDYVYPNNHIRPHAVSSIGTISYQYDNNGNMTNKGGVNITYDYDNRPVSIGSNINAYDYSGQRVIKNNTLYIGQLYECTGGTCTKYIFAGGSRIAQKSGSTVNYYHTDHLGSSSIITNSSGSKVEETYYYPYGVTRSNSGSVYVTHKYTGQEEDAEVGLYYYGARYYDPNIGRFISADTIVQAPGDPQTLNRYSYALNNPIIYTDPNGNIAIIDDIIVGAIIGAAIGGAVSAITGGDVLQGIVTGAITGGFFGGAGGILEGYGLENVIQAKVGIHAAAGGISGGINSSIYGGDIGLGIITGGIAGGLGAFGGQYLPEGNWPAQIAGRSLIGGVSGGITAEIYGGDFWDGFVSGAKTAAIASIANDWLHFMMKAEQNRQIADDFFDSIEGKAAKYLVGPIVKGMTGTTVGTELAREAGTVPLKQGFKSLMTRGLSGFRGLATLGGATGTVASMTVNMVGSSIVGYHTFNAGLYIGSYVEALPELLK